MTRELGSYNTSGSRTHVRFQFSTHAAAGGNVAPNSAFEAADLRIYRASDSAAYSATQRSSANGITMTSPFDSLTGVHDVDIDLTDNTDAGFYAAGYRYAVVLSPDETVDSQTITGVVLAEFEIGPPQVNVTQVGGSATPVTNLGIVFNTDFATNYSTTTDKWQVEANVLQIEGSDATNQIRDAVVDDATRIDASALNTLSGHDPGENIMGATDLGTGAGLTSLAPSATALSTAQWTNTRAGYLDNLSAGAVATASALTSLAGIFTGITSLAQWLGLIAGKQTGNSTARTELRATGAGSGTYDETADSQEAVRDRGDAAWATATGFSTHSAADVVSAIGDGSALTEAGGTGDHLTAIPWNASWDAEVQSEVTDALNAALTEAYRSTGATGSVAQLLYEIIAHLGNSAIASTTKTLTKLDKSTTAKTFTLDDDTTPTAIEEAT